MLSPKDQLLKKIDPKEYFQKEFPEWDGNEKTFVLCPRGYAHEKGEDTNPSLSIEPVSGAFKCWGCGFHGTSVIGYHTDIYCDGNFRKALAQLYSRYVQDIIPGKNIKRYIDDLWSRKSIVRQLSSVRGWTEQTLKDLRLGWCATRQRLVIPIYNRVGYCLDTRFHDSLYRAPLSKKGKRMPMLNLKNAQPGNYFPFTESYNPFDDKKDEIWIVEGEPDAITGYQEKLNVVTVTGGGSMLEKLSYDQLVPFRGKHVIILADNDATGRRASAAMAKRLVAVDILSLRVATVPQGKDLTEYLTRHRGSVEALRRIVASTPYVVEPTRSSAPLLPLSATSNADNYGSWVHTDVLVNGTHSSPVVIPKRIELVCSGDLCSQCPCESGKGEYYVTQDDPAILEWMYVSPQNVEKKIRQEMRLPKSCQLHCKIGSYQNLQQLSMIPALTINSGDDQANYAVRTGYKLGEEAQANTQYRITAKPLRHPISKESVLLVDKATSSSDSISSFKLSRGEVESLKKQFSGEPKKIISDICEFLAYEHTKIYGRPDLHAAIDLVYHSPRRFSFSGVDLSKGSIELLIVGDTRCGKGQVAEGLVKFYDLGLVISGENATFAGLCGGLVKSTGENFTLAWGAIPLNHGRLVIIDEFSGLDKELIGKLSRIRSEGVAEIAKAGIVSKTASNTRLVWISNSRKGRDVSSFGSGVHAIKDLIGANEDIARFDLAMVVAKGEFDIANLSEHITRRSNSTGYTRELLRRVVLWVWSLTSDQVVFTEEATKLILTESLKLAGRYSATIPLIQAENARFKLAKVSAAVAGRCFSTDNGHHLIVRSSHVMTAVSLMRHFYDKPIMGYRDFANQERSTAELTDTETLTKLFLAFNKENRLVLINGLLESEYLSLRELQDWCATETPIARKHMSILVKCRAVKSIGAGNYIKKPKFTQFLKRLKNE